MIQRNLYETSGSGWVGPPSNESSTEGSKALFFADEVSRLSNEGQFEEDIRNDFKTFVDYFTSKIHAYFSSDTSLP